MGDGVNIAARLEGIAKPGAICNFGGRLSASEVAARSRGQRSARNPAQEHRRAQSGFGLILFPKTFESGGLKTRTPCTDEGLPTYDCRPPTSVMYFS